MNTVKLFLLKEIAGPAIRRLGTGVGVYLASIGVASDAVTAIQAGAVAALGVVFDLVVSNLNRKAQ